MTRTSRKAGLSKSRRRWRPAGVLLGLAMIVALVGAVMLSGPAGPAAAKAQTASNGKEAFGFGECSHYGCSCPGYYGFGYTCYRGGCGHHYDEHY